MAEAPVLGVIPALGVALGLTPVFLDAAGSGWVADGQVIN